MNSGGEALKTGTNVNTIQIHPGDNVAVVTVAVAKGMPLVGIGNGEIAAVTDIPRHHKVAIEAIARDTPIVKYGETIALAREAIAPGEWVHTHNIIA
jgi:hypothetical protein